MVKNPCSFSISQKDTKNNISIYIYIYSWSFESFSFIHYVRKAHQRHKLETSPQKLVSDLVKRDVPTYGRCTLYI
jgi:hypothetical protein